MYVEGGAGSAGAVVAAGTSLTALAGAGWMGGPAASVIALGLVGTSLVGLRRFHGSWRLAEEERRAERSPDPAGQRPAGAGEAPDWFLDLGATWGRGESPDEPDRTLAHRGRPVGRLP
ncbi:MAG: hypothetical protein R2704_05620 [Microthrixaceae bacterium]